MIRLEAFRQNSGRYAALIEPSMQISRLTEADMADLVECLDYSRLSTTPRSKSQGGNEGLLLSNIPSPFVDDFLNLLPLRPPGINSFPNTLPDFPDFSTVLSPGPLSPGKHPSAVGNTNGHIHSTSLNLSTDPMSLHQNSVDSVAVHSDAESTMSQQSPTNTMSQPQPPSQFYPTGNVATHASPRSPSSGGGGMGQGLGETPYRRPSMTNGRRPWYEQPNRTGTANGDDVSGIGGMLPLGEMIH